jgi:uncharacterized protein YndB with AHSA1/START domain
MASIETSRIIDASQTNVWDVVADPRKFEQWNTLHTRWEGEPPRELALGSQVTEVVSIMKIPNTVTFTAVAFEPPNQVSLAGKGTGGINVALTLLRGARRRQQVRRHHHGRRGRRTAVRPHGHS